MPDPLRGWRETPTRESVLDFVKAVTNPDSVAFVPEFERVAVFDNDGTLSTENPYAQLAFALDRAAELAKPTTPDDLRAGGIAAVLELVKLTHSSVTTDEFDAVVRTWIAAARHPRFGRPYPSTVYQPMLELLAPLGCEPVHMLDLLGRRGRLHARLGASRVRPAAASHHRQLGLAHLSGRGRGTRVTQGHGPRRAR